MNNEMFSQTCLIISQIFLFGLITTKDKMDFFLMLFLTILWLIISLINAYLCEGKTE